jgi:hypothetical protein
MKCWKYTMIDTNIDILVEKTSSLIEALDKYVSG